MTDIWDTVLVSGSKTHDVLENMFVFKCKAQQKNLSWWTL